MRTAWRPKKEPTQGQAQRAQEKGDPRSNSEVPSATFKVYVPACFLSPIKAPSISQMYRPAMEELLRPSTSSGICVCYDNEKMRYQYIETVSHCPYWMTGDKPKFLGPQDSSKGFKSLSFPFSDGGGWGGMVRVSPKMVCR